MVICLQSRRTNDVLAVRRISMMAFWKESTYGVRSTECRYAFQDSTNGPVKERLLYRGILLLLTVVLLLYDYCTGCRVLQYYCSSLRISTLMSGRCSCQFSVLVHRVTYRPTIVAELECVSESTRGAEYSVQVLRPGTPGFLLHKIQYLQ